MQYPLIALGLCFIATRRSLGAGLAVLFAIGYFNGIIRANVVSMYTTFMFDAALLGMYAAVFVEHSQAAKSLASAAAGKWISVLIIWALIITVIPQNDMLVQFVAFRATAWFLPIIWIGCRLTAADMLLLALSLAGLNLIALVFGVYEYFFGVESLYPVNSVTQIIYKSAASGGFLRIPSTFLNAHGYGGTMICSLPFLLGRLIDGRGRQLERFWLLAGIAAAFGGILLCSARQPLVVAGLVMLITWFLTKFSFRMTIGIVATFLAMALLVAGNERLQRITTLKDTDRLVFRVYSSMNENFLDLFVNYPFGAGMGSSAGTSIPYFLAGKAPKAIGLENEYCRILVDQGWIGLFLWLAFIGWVHIPLPKRSGQKEFGSTVLVMYAMTLTTWATATIGTGLLASVPSTAMLLTQMGCVIAHSKFRSVNAPPNGGNANPTSHVTNLLTSTSAADRCVR